MARSARYPSRDVVTPAPRVLARHQNAEVLQNQERLTEVTVDLGSPQLPAGGSVNCYPVLRLVSKAISDLGNDFQRFDLFAIQFEEESKIHWAARKVAG